MQLTQSGTAIYSKAGLSVIDKRTALVTKFLRQTEWATASRTPLAGDASSRKYERLINRSSGQHAVLMDAPPVTTETLAPFLNIARHLSKLGFSAPKILHSDVQNGFLLLEDLGDALFARVAKAEPSKEQEIYEGAVDFLIDLHTRPLPTTCPVYSARDMANFTAIIFDFYAPETSAQDKQLILNLLTTVLECHQPFTPVLALRDFHSENLIWLPERSGSKRIGLLDFQDAIVSHPAYDLISLTTDARRDVSRSLAKHLIMRYMEKTGQDKEQFLSAAAAISVQRNLRILGIFARLALQGNKLAYIDLIPRVWGYLMQDINHPSLVDLRGILMASLPSPSSKFLQRLREQCPRNQTQY